ncbi:CHAT domain-containing protein [Acrocarpospora corrugata]|uniref:CHAT domain-containing protein n=1 Tax=Acrocarpospora corrugata TaxID=35763 RepID=A0A5M3W7Y3_9ACTN|nr:CHAT domain-containing protein [Acrocarpospora corrugata]GES04092.1 CHAT domain-containing protein [Acrocarpospora corrugata]
MTSWREARARHERRVLLEKLESRLLAVDAGGDPLAILDDEAVELVQRLLALVPDPAEDLPATYTAGAVHWWRYQVRSDADGQADLFAAMRLLSIVYEAAADQLPPMLREFVEMTAPDGMFQPDETVDIAIWNGGVDLLEEWEQTGDPAYLDDAAAQFLLAVPAGHHQRAEMLASLIENLHELWQQNREPAALVKAAELGRLAGEDNHKILSLHAAVLWDLGKESNDLLIVTEAVEAARLALSVAGPDYPERVVYLSNLGIYLRTLYQRTQVVERLAEAVDLGREVVELAPDHPVYLTNLGVALATYSERPRDFRTLAEAIDIHRRAVAAATSDDPGRARFLSNLGDALRMSYTYEKDEHVLAEAIAVCREAVELTPPGDAQRAMYLYNLGAVLEPVSVREALEAFAESAETEGATATLRLNANRRLADAAMGVGEFTRALAAYEAAIALLAAVASRSLERPDREHGLGQAVGLASEAAAAAIELGRPERAVELLELARGVLLGEVIGARGDRAELRARAPGLAAQFELVREELDLADHTTLTDELVEYSEMDVLERILVDAQLLEPDARVAARPVAVRRRELAVEWDALLAEIRAVPGLEEFLLPPGIDRLWPQAADGPIVLVNLSWHRCDALIVTADPDRPVRVVPLSTLTHQDVLDQVTRFLGAVADTETGTLNRRRAAQQQIHQVLRWAWDHITGPVLEALGFTGPPGETWPRLWWCPQRELTFLPLHATGHHDGGTGTVLDRVISSYTPTIRALRHARLNIGEPASIKATALIVAMPETPNAPDLPGARTETRRLTELIPAARVLSGEQATRDAVIEAIPDHAIVHLACHGLSDWNSPDSSRLLLHDHATRPLTVTGISLLDLTRARLAYLSACSTTAGNQRLADEAVHITGAFQLAGYQQVVGTLWPIRDVLATRVADAVYTHLTADGTTTPATEHTALALHLAIRQLRDQFTASPAQWAAHVHVGI